MEMEKQDDVQEQSICNIQSYKNSNKQKKKTYRWKSIILSHKFCERQRSSSRWSLRSRWRKNLNCKVLINENQIQQQNQTYKRLGSSSCVIFSPSQWSSVVPGFGINQYVPVRTSVPLYRGSLGSYHTMLIIEWYRTLPPRYRPVQTGMDSDVAGMHLPYWDPCQSVSVEKTIDYDSLRSFFSVVALLL